MQEKQMEDFTRSCEQSNMLLFNKSTQRDHQLNSAIYGQAILRINTSRIKNKLLNNN